MFSNVDNTDEIVIWVGRILLSSKDNRIIDMQYFYIMGYFLELVNKPVCQTVKNSNIMMRYLSIPGLSFLFVFWNRHISRYRKWISRKISFGYSGSLFIVNQDLDSIDFNIFYLSNFLNLLRFTFLWKVKNQC